MMKVWAAIAVLCLGPGAAWGQTATFKCPKPGTVVQYDNGTVTTYQGGGPTYCNLFVKQTNGENVTYHWFAPTLMIRDSSASGFESQLKPGTLWPLAVGKKLSGRYDGAGNTPGHQGSWMNDVTVDAYEKITTKAGTFDAFSVTKKDEALYNKFKSTFRQWYVPELGMVVKYSYADSNGINRASEATSIRQ